MWLGILAVVTAAITGWFAILKLREANNIADLSARVRSLEHERGQNLRVITTLQSQNRLLRREGVDLRRMLAKYEQAAHESLIVTNESGIITEWDAAASLMFGFSADEAVGEDISMLVVPPDFRQFHRMAMANIFKFKRQPRTVPIRAKGLCKTGDLIDLEIQLLPGWEVGDSGSWRYGARIRKTILTSTQTTIVPHEAPPTDVAIPTLPPAGGHTP